MYVDCKVPKVRPLFLGITAPIMKYGVTCYLELFNALNCYKEWKVFTSKVVNVRHCPNNFFELCYIDYPNRCMQLFEITQCNNILLKSSIFTNERSIQ